MKQHKYRFLIMSLLVVLLAGCTIGTHKTNSDNDQMEMPADVSLIHAEASRDEPYEVNTLTVNNLVRGNNQFAFELYQELSEETMQNLIFSPFSISNSFSAVYGGARGKTADQLANVLHLLSNEEQHQAFNAIDQYLTEIGIEGRNEGTRFQLNIANAVWIQEGFPIQDDYLDLLAQQYGAGIWQADFANDIEETQEAINLWVSQATENRITKLAPPLNISQNTKFVLVNAIYFKGSWWYRFDKEATSDEKFTLLEGNEVAVPMMHGEPIVPYYKDETIQAIQLPYVGGAEMVIILPEQRNFEEVEKRLNNELINKIRQSGKEHEVTLTMPRFEFESTVPLINILHEMGLTVPFNYGEADFNDIAEDSGLFISDAVHKGTITVDEEGTEAAAVTGIDIAVSEPMRVEMNLNRPFIFAILERETGIILFLGRVMDPSN